MHRGIVQSSNLVAAAPENTSSHTFTERALAQISDAIVVLDFDGVILHWSPSAERIYGYTPDEVTGQNLWNALYCMPESGMNPKEVDLRALTEWSGRISRIAHDGTVRDFNVRRIRSNGTGSEPDVVIEYSSAAIPENSLPQTTPSVGSMRRNILFEAMSTAAFLIDTSELLNACEWLRSEGVENFRSYVARHPEFLEEAMDFISVVEVNPAAVKMMAVDDESDLVGHPVGKFWSREGITTFIRSLEHGFYGWGSFEEKTIFQRVDGKRFQIHYSHNISDTLRDRRRLLIGLTDISDFFAAEQALLEVKNNFAHHGRLATLGELSASISHEISQPLGAIMNFAGVGRRLLQRETLDIEKLVMIQDNIVADAQRAADIIGRTRSMASKTPGERSNVPVNTLVEQALGFMGHELRSNSVALHSDLEAVGIMVAVDAVQIQQVVVNLVMNAIQEMQAVPLAKRALYISTGSLSDGVFISVEDRGNGFTDENHARLFENFFTTKKTGMGMGLAICKLIVEAHGGMIAAENVSPSGTGARFTITLP